MSKKKPVFMSKNICVFLSKDFIRIEELKN